MPDDFPPRTTPTSSDPLLDEALEWLVRIHSGPASEQVQAECDAWRMRSLDHERAYLEAESLWQDVGRVPPYHSARLLTGSQRVPRNTAWALAACILLSIGAFLQEPVKEWIKAATADYLTSVGEQRLITLEDGSTIQLNTDTAINVAFSAEKRDIRLIKGEAAFTVVGESERPFTVHSNSIRTRALGTIFTVRLHQHRISVTVLEHTVQVDTCDGATTTPPLILKEGEQVLFSSSQGLGAVQRVHTSTETSWQRGKLIFEAKPLTEVVDELNRYRHGRIFILNPTLRPLKVTGVFDVADPDAALRTIHRTLSIHETALSPYILLLH